MKYSVFRLFFRDALDDILNRAIEKQKFRNEAEKKTQMFDSRIMNYYQEMAKSGLLAIRNIQQSEIYTPNSVYYGKRGEFGVCLDSVWRLFGTASELFQKLNIEAKFIHTRLHPCAKFEFTELTKWKQTQKNNYTTLIENWPVRYDTPQTTISEMSDFIDELNMVNYNNQI